MTAKSTSIMSGSMEELAGVAILTQHHRAIFRLRASDETISRSKYRMGSSPTVRSQLRVGRADAHTEACVYPVVLSLGPVISLSSHHVDATDTRHVGSWSPTVMRSFYTRFQCGPGDE